MSVDIRDLSSAKTASKERSLFRKGQIELIITITIFLAKLIFFDLQITDTLEFQLLQTGYRGRVQKPPAVSWGFLARMPSFVD
jgi:hypothetical protein